MLNQIGRLLYLPLHVYRIIDCERTLPYLQNLHLILHASFLCVRKWTYFAIEPKPPDWNSRLQSLNKLNSFPRFIDSFFFILDLDVKRSIYAFWLTLVSHSITASTALYLDSSFGACEWHMTYQLKCTFGTIKDVGASILLQTYTSLSLF